MEKLFALVAIFSVTVACQSQPEPEADSPAEEESSVEEATNDEITDGQAADGDAEDMIVEGEENVNDVNGLDGEEGGGDGGERKCPPAEDLDPDEVCAQVIVYGLTEDGICCQYPNPCVVPDEIVEEFNSIDDCRTAAGRMK